MKPRGSVKSIKKKKQYETIHLQLREGYEVRLLQKENSNAC